MNKNNIIIAALLFALIGIGLTWKQQATDFDLIDQSSKEMNETNPDDFVETGLDDLKLDNSTEQNNQTNVDSAAEINSELNEIEKELNSLDSNTYSDNLSDF